MYSRRAIISRKRPTPVTSQPRKTYELLNYRKRTRSAVALRTAIELGDYAAVKKAIGRHPCLVHCPTGPTADLPVHVAAQAGHRRIIGLLLSMGADPNARNAHLRTPAHLSVLHRKDRVARLLFGDGADPAAVDGSNNTALDLAILMNEKQCLNVLLNFEMPKNVVNRAFYKATTNGNIILMNKLLNRGAIIDHKNEVTGFTALLEAFKCKHVRSVQFLLEKGADPSVYDWTSRWTCLHYAVYYMYPERILLMILENLVACGKLNQTVEFQTSDTQETALHLAVRQRNLPAVFALLRAEARSDVVDREGRTALLSAISDRWNTAAALMINTGHYLNHVPGTITHIMSLRAVVGLHSPDSLFLVQYMLERGCTVVDPDDHNLDQTVIHLACESGDVDMLECLLAYTSQDVLNDLHAPERSMPPIVLAAKKGHGSAVDMLLARGVDVNAYASGGCGETALHAAVRAGNGALVDRLLDAGARTDVRDAHGIGRRPLEVAVYTHGHQSTVTAHLVHSDRLAKAVVRDDTDAVAFLLACGVTPNATTEAHGGTALHAAVRHRRYEMTAVLLSSDRCQTATRYNGVTALDLALAMGDVRSAEMIVARQYRPQPSSMHTTGHTTPTSTNDAALQ